MSPEAVTTGAGGTAVLDAPPESVPEDPTAAEDAARQSVADELSPCRVCGVNAHEGPEGEVWSGVTHCWKCGYRPGVTPTAGVVMHQTGLSTAQQDRLVTELRKGVVQDLLDAIRSGQVTADDLSGASVSVIPPAS